ncbi:ankyrin repeat domain-containing protein [Sinomicrobium sp.]
MRNFRLLIILVLLLVVGKGEAQESIFLSRDFWKTNPSPEIVDQKIKEGNDPAAATPFNFDGVVYAILEDAPNEAIIRLISKEGNGVNKLTHDGRTYIFWAAYRGNSELMKYLLDKGAKTDIVDDHGMTILNFAANAGNKNLEVYELCLQHGADLKNDLSRDGANALLLAASKDDDLKLTEYFSSKGLDINAADKNGNGIFNYVAKAGNIALMDKLLGRGIKGNDQAFLMAATGVRGASNGVEVYKYLESKGLSPEVVDKNGSTPLHIAASRSKDVEVIRYLLDKGLNGDQADHNGNTPFMNAAANNDLKIVQLLSENLKDINRVNKKSQSALSLAVQGNTSDVVEFLIKKGADVKLADADGNTLVSYLVNSLGGRGGNGTIAVFNEKLDLLKKNGLDISKPQGNGNTWYHLAVDKDNVELLKLAQKAGQDINARNKEGNTPLLLAAMRAKDDVLLKQLLQLGADKSLTTDFEESAYDLASENEVLKKNKISLDFLK